MDLGFYLSPFLPLFFLVVCVVRYQQWRWKRNVRLRRRNPGFFPTYASFGNALQTLQILAEPQMGYVMEEKEIDEVDEDEDGEEDPERVFHRQLRRIRRGEVVERLIISSKKMI